ncbi:alpha/beta hydrolase [Roseicella frigidaeris]|uniref:Alpha/beta hydrolase n=2 Tax=Roseicella frigidaeris TaxID=2230885 RepID=A0A327LXD8_9PROT|nr:alpha/beta hydrolase [Roseicella frigidaeris]
MQAAAGSIDGACPAIPARRGAPAASLPRRALLAGLLAAPACGGRARAQAGADGAAVTLPGATERLLTARGGAAYRLMIGKPPGDPPAAGWPVLYLLDGNAAFATAYHAMRSQSARPVGTGVLPALVVGIGYPTEEMLDLRRRALDYTPALPPRAAGDPPPAPDLFPAPGPTGGAEAFLDLLAETVQPAVAAAHPVDARRQALFGHSYGGLLVLHALFTRPGGFRDYLAISPSIWFGDRLVLREEARFAAAPVPAGLGLFMAVGGEEQSLPPGQRQSPDAAARAALLGRRAMVEGARAMAGRLAALPGLRTEFVEAAGENHASVVPTVMSRALRFAFSPAG